MRGGGIDAASEGPYAVKMERRPLTTRDKNWAKKLAAMIAGTGITPDMISVSSSVFAAMTFGFQFLYGHENISLALWGIIATIQLRLLANMFDGMVAVEFNQKSVMGEVFNDLPDRVSDALVFMGFAFILKDKAWGVELSYGAGILAVMTAYIRVLGNGLGVKDLFLGPMAKQHRMFFVTLSCLIGFFWKDVFLLMIILIDLGMVVTCVRRLSKISKSLNGKV